MMQLLEAGGMEVLTDGTRIADPDNPKGYYEWEPMKGAARNPELFGSVALCGKAVKCVSMLLPSLPAEHTYKVIFMMRPIREVAASQAEMLRRSGRTGMAVFDLHNLEAQLLKHRDRTLAWLRKAANFEVMELDYPSLVTRPNETIPRIVKFAGAELLPTAAKMSSVIDPSLHRKR